MWFANKRKIAGACVLGATTILAVTSLAAASAGTVIQSQICPPFGAPVLTMPASDYETEDNSAALAGTADAGMVVEITDNNTGVGATTAASDGSFNLTVPLSGGANDLRASVTNSCDTTKSSTSVTVTRIIPAPPPVPIPTSPNPATSPSAPTPPTVVGGLVPVPIAPTLPVPAPLTPPTSPLPAPTILEPKAGQRTSKPYTEVQGTAQAGVAVQVLVNGRVVAQVIAGSDGTFNTQVPLRVGTNTIQAQIVTGNNTIISSGIVTITYIPSVQSHYPSLPTIACILIVIILLLLITFLLRRWLGAKVKRWDSEHGEDDGHKL